ncbi:hypothetical protein Bca52824_092798 [Brassica carinata]|uniref:NAD-dependent epimerase/dehydratase domain-containing protein n=1 Tax=Brassica carinata TaxID=52824 RepID=A0A8X7P3R5_BRACI|nr:hypothetical protein Bca52824_092798 [Brassica carinata]
MESNGDDRKTTTYCVTGANGDIGSWLVKFLLERGYIVHATLRDLGNERLILFRADLQDDGSFDGALKGCDGVFHGVRYLTKSQYVQSKVVDPAIKAVRNVLGSCLLSKSVKRVVFTSSISSLKAKDENERWRSIVDQICKTPIDHIYVQSKLVSEEEAFRYAKERGLDLVSVIRTTVSGPFLTPSLSSSLQVLLYPITGACVFVYDILSGVNKRMGSIGLAHIQDICMAHLFLMEEPKSEGQYICCVDSIDMHDLMLINFCKDQSLIKAYVFFKKKLRELRFEYRYGIEEIIHPTIDASISFRFPTLNHKLKQ